MFPGMTEMLELCIKSQGECSEGDRTHYIELQYMHI
jgi:hypothetical protein